MTLAVHELRQAMSWLRQTAFYGLALSPSLAAEAREVRP